MKLWLSVWKPKQGYERFPQFLSISDYDLLYCNRNKPKWYSNIWGWMVNKFAKREKVSLKVTYNFGESHRDE